LEIEILNRKAPAFPDNLRAQKFPSARANSTYIIDVTTPLFGGGVTAGENDPVTLIRVPAIRGHLRFWWRATRGARFQTSAELAEAEGNIWGTTTEPSRVELAVTITNQGKQESCEALVNRGRLGYALFPFQGNSREKKPPAKCTRGVQFALLLRYPEEFTADVGAAMWAWVNFGGIGARTRRGCGALFCKPLAPTSPDQVGAWLDTNRTNLEPSDSSLRAWPTLGSVHVHPQSDGPENAWNTVVSLLHRFRQGDIGRNAGQGGRPGRTRWPEADSLRALTGQADPRHVQSTTLANPRLDHAFPRAGLGLPIVFHFKDRQDPAQLELYPDWEDSTRMASPIILRPLAVGEGSKAVPMIVRLRAPGPPALKFSNRSLGTFPGKQSVLRPDLATYPNSPMARRSKEGSAIIAFLALAKEAGFKEVR
jgi:CRISPR-associated protein Cmr1